MLKISQSENRKRREKIGRVGDNIAMNLENREYESVGRI